MTILVDKKEAFVNCDFCKEHAMISNDDDHASKKLTRWMMVERREDQSDDGAYFFELDYLKKLIFRILFVSRYLD